MCELTTCTLKNCTIELSYCHCGCGEKTSIAKDTSKAVGRIKGEPMRFLPLHGRTGVAKKRDTHIITKAGYILIRKPDHPYAQNGYVAEHRLVVEECLKRYLQPGECVYHRGTRYTKGSMEDKADNRIGNLQVVMSQSEMNKALDKVKPPEITGYKTCDTCHDEFWKEMFRENESTCKGCEYKASKESTKPVSLPRKESRPYNNSLLG